jgi:hypothetical protein
LSGATRDVSAFVVVRAVLDSEVEVVAGSASDGEAERFREGGGEVRVVRAWTTSAILGEVGEERAFEQDCVGRGRSSDVNQVGFRWKVEVWEI